MRVQAVCDAIAQIDGSFFIHPYATIDTIEGQGSLALELKEQLSFVPPIFFATGGGGLPAGVSLVLQDTPLYLCEPEGKNLREQLDGNEDLEQISLPTIADGIRTRLLGEENMRLLKAHKHSEDEICSAMVLIWTRLKQHVEPTAAVPLAGLIKVSSSSSFPFKSAVVILCGGNVDVSFTP